MINRVIDEIWATSEIGLNGRGIVHIDVRDVNQINRRGTILIENKVRTYIHKQVKQVYQNKE